MIHSNSIYCLSHFYLNSSFYYCQCTLLNPSVSHQKVNRMFILALIYLSDLIHSAHLLIQILNYVVVYVTMNALLCNWMQCVHYIIFTKLNFAWQKERKTTTKVGPQHTSHKLPKYIPIQNQYYIWFPNVGMESNFFQLWHIHTNSYTLYPVHGFFLSYLISFAFCSPGYLKWQGLNSVLIQDRIRILK